MDFHKIISCRGELLCGFMLDYMELPIHCSWMDSGGVFLPSETMRKIKCPSADLITKLALANYY